MAELKINTMGHTIDPESRINCKERRLTFRDILRYFSDPAREKELNMPLVATSSVMKSIQFCPVIGIVNDSNNGIGIVIDKSIKED